MINQKHLIIICLAAMSSNFIVAFSSGLVMFESSPASQLVSAGPKSELTGEFSAFILALSSLTLLFIESMRADNYY